ncbi:lipid A biosynthesis acyltransferase, partial [Acinetobacter baumannii]
LDNVYNIDPAEAIKTVNRLKAEALGNSTQPEALKTSVV